MNHTGDADGLNPRQRKFVERFLDGIPSGRAYEAAGYSSRGARADTLASQLLAKPAVAAVVAKERAHMRERARMSRDDLLDYLCDVIRTPIGEINEKSPLVQEHSVDEIGEAVVRTRVKMVGKMDAIKQLALMLNWNAPLEVKHTGDLRVVIGGDVD